MNSITDQQEQRIYEALYAGRKIEAIKLHREATGSGLKESKDFIEALDAQLRSESPEKFNAPPAKTIGCSGAAILTLAMCVALIVGMRAMLLWS